MSPRDGHVITVSGCLILTAANSSSYGWLTKCQFLQDVTVDISLHEVCVRVGVLYVITKFSRMDGLPNFLTHGAPQARASRARAPLLLLLLLPPPPPPPSPPLLLPLLLLDCKTV